MDSSLREQWEQMIGGPLPPRLVGLYRRYVELSRRLGGSTRPSVNVMVALTMLTESEGVPKPKPKPKRARKPKDG